MGSTNDTFLFHKSWATKLLEIPKIITRVYHFWKWHLTWYKNKIKVVCRFVRLFWHQFPTSNLMENRKVFFTIDMIGHDLPKRKHINWNKKPKTFDEKK